MGSVTLRLVLLHLHWKQEGNMIGIDFPYENVVALTPQGALTEEDFDRVGEAIDGHMNERDAAPNILVHVHGIPHWASLSAMSRHFHLVKEHQRMVKKVAFVGDVGLLGALP